MKKSFVLIAALLVAGCTAPDSAKEVLEKQGYTNLEVGGYGWFACSEDDWFATQFKGTSPTGDTVEGTVCKGVFKGSTIRFE
jgi:hypothetical protein